MSIFFYGAPATEKTNWSERYVNISSDQFFSMERQRQRKQIAGRVYQKTLNVNFY
jgi:hypothetical protein